MKYKINVIALLLICAGVAFSCKKDNVELENETVDAQTPDLTFGGFLCELDGEKFEMIVKIGGDITGSVGYDGEIGDVVIKKYESSVDNYNTDESAGMKIGDLVFSRDITAPRNLFSNLFIEGKKTYTLNAKNGVEVSININEEYWSTSKGKADQTGSEFEITEKKDYDAFGSQFVEINAKFSCILYNETGDSKKLTNGIYVGSFENM